MKKTPAVEAAPNGGKEVAKDTKSDVDAILKALVFLYTENRRLTKEIAARASLTGPQLTVVKMLESMGDLSLSELSDAIRAQNSTVTGIIDRMEREELVERIRSTQDRRVVYIRLTEKGRKLAREIPVEPIVIFREALDGLTAAETRETLKIVNKITARFRTAISRQLDEGEGSHE
jgi:DNA-binding MarR family transcriptional regulator